MTLLWKTRLMLMFHSTLLSKSENQIISAQNTWTKMHSVQSRPQGTREWQICCQQKHLHQYWNSQNRDSLRGSWCYGIYRRARTKASARQSIPLCHQFRYLFWPSTQGLFFWAEPQSGPLTDGKSIRKGPNSQKCCGKRGDSYGGDVRDWERNTRWRRNEDVIRAWRSEKEARTSIHTSVCKWEYEKERYPEDRKPQMRSL